MEPLIAAPATAVLFGALPSSGDGYGDGYGDGSGYGSGYGYGDGYGYGYGYGDGYGDGSKEYWASAVAYFASKWSGEQRQRLDELRAAGETIAFWRSDRDGRACNGGHNDPVQVGMIERVSGPLDVCHAGTLHATLIPPKWKGERWWIVAMIGEVQWEEDKVGALQREIIGECL